MLKRVLKVAIPLGVLAVFFILMWLASYNLNWQVTDTRGPIAHQQRDLFYLTSGLMLLIIIPMIVLLFAFAYRYRDSRPATSSSYMPDWSENHKLELVWWGIPILIITVLSVVAWRTTHTLDPYQPLTSTAKPLEVQVVGLQWRWLFIYPEQNIASLNELRMPIDRPVAFTITSDAPMNSFWIPQLGGQIYAMPAMSTKLHLSADKPGVYKGIAANITGEGHASMKFDTHAVSQKDFDAWVHERQSAKDTLDTARYEELRKPSKDMQVRYFRVSGEIYNTAVNRYHGNHSMGGH